MPAGLQAFAADGSNFLQVDGDYQNLFLRHKGTLTASPVSGATQPIATVLWEVQCQGAPVVVLSQDTVIALDIAAVSGQGYGNPGTYRINFIMPGNGRSFEAWVFDKLVQSDLSNWGIQVFNEQGQVVFDAAKKPMRVVQLFTATGINGGQWTPPAGAYARLGVACTSGAYTNPIGHPTLQGYFRYGAVGGQSGGTVAIGNFLSGMQGGMIDAGNRPSMGIVVDLTNY